ncbi:MAG: hypothetical protein M3Q69_15090 [Acidobacteriota bacterium]|nr:hypothetical protein [Acidobacteriota bacterium]
MKTRLTLSLLFFLTLRVYAAPVWVVAGSVRVGEEGCSVSRPMLTWNANGVAHNLGESAAAVRVLGFSNGLASTPATVTLDAAASAYLPLRPTDNLPPLPPVYIAKLDVPDQVRIESRLTFSYDQCLGAPPLGPAGKVALPVYRALIPANTQQVHLGTDLGIQDVRVNVGIYNAGSQWATAAIVMRRPSCRSSADRTTLVSIPPDSLVQVTALPPLPCDTASLVEPHVTYAVVTVDQPSVSYAVALSNTNAPVVTVGVGTP